MLLGATGMQTLKEIASLFVETITWKKNIIKKYY